MPREIRLIAIILILAVYSHLLTFANAGHPWIPPPE